MPRPPATVVRVSQHATILLEVQNCLRQYSRIRGRPVNSIIEEAVTAFLHDYADYRTDEERALCTAGLPSPPTAKDRWYERLLTCEEIYKMLGELYGADNKDFGLISDRYQDADRWMKEKGFRADSPAKAPEDVKAQAARYAFALSQGKTEAEARAIAEPDLSDLV